MGNPYGRGHRIEEDLEFRRALSLLALAFHERALHALAFGGVGGDQGQPYHLVVFDDRGQADGDIDEFSVLVLPDGFAMESCLAVNDLAHYLRVFVLEELGDEAGTALTHDFVGAVPEDALCAPVPSENDAVPGFANDGGVRGLNHGSQQLGVRGDLGLGGAPGLLTR